MQMALLGETLDRFDRRPFGLGSEDQAAIDRYAVHQHGAGAAVAVVTAFLRAGQMQRVAKNFQQALPWLAQKLGCFTVDGRADVEFFGHGNCVVCGSSSLSRRRLTASGIVGAKRSSLGRSPEASLPPAILLAPARRLG